MTEAEEKNRKERERGGEGMYVPHLGLQLPVLRWFFMTLFGN